MQKDSEIFTQLGSIDATLKILVKHHAQNNITILGLIKTQQDNKEELTSNINKMDKHLQKQISANKTEQAKFAVWIRIVAGVITAAVGGLTKKIFF